MDMTSRFELSFSDKLAVALACLASAMALILFWMDKTPLAAGLSIACIAGLSVYPILHFFPSGTARIPMFIIATLLVVIFGWKIWPRKQLAAKATTAASAPTMTPPLPVEQPAKPQRKYEPFYDSDPSKPYSLSNPPPELAANRRRARELCPPGTAICELGKGNKWDDQAFFGGKWSHLIVDAGSKNEFTHTQYIATLDEAASSPENTRTVVEGIYKFHASKWSNLSADEHHKKELAAAEIEKQIDAANGDSKIVAGLLQELLDM